MTVPEHIRQVVEVDLVALKHKVRRKSRVKTCREGVLVEGIDYTESGIGTGA